MDKLELVPVLNIIFINQLREISSQLDIQNVNESELLELLNPKEQKNIVRQNWIKQRLIASKFINMAHQVLCMDIDSTDFNEFKIREIIDPEFIPDPEIITREDLK